MNEEKQQKRNVPELRFPEFSGEWEEKKVKDEFKVVSGSTPLRSKKEYYDNNGIPWIKTMNLNNSELYTVSERVSELAVKELKLKILPKNTILIAMYGGFNQIGRTGLLTFDSTINQAISALLDINQQHNSHFFQSYFNYNVNKWRRYAASSRKDPNITKKDIENFKIIFPPYTEQQKIGSFLSKLDRQIELEEKKLALLEEQKKGYMQKIFSQELRFKDENGNDYPEWEKKKLGEVSKITMGQSPKSSNYTDNEEDMILVQGNADLKNGNVEPRLFTKEVTKVAEINDILLTVRAPVGEIGIAQYPVVIGRGVCSIKGSEFIYFYLEYLKSINWWSKISQGSTFESISGNEIRELVIQLPKDKNEEQKIISTLNRISSRVMKLKQKILLLNERKKALLQKVLL